MHQPHLACHCASGQGAPVQPPGGLRHRAPEARSSEALEGLQATQVRQHRPRALADHHHALRAQFGGRASKSKRLFISALRCFELHSSEVQLIRAARLQKRFGLCLGCQVLVAAPTGTDLASERLVLETEHFVVSAPFACRERWRLYLAPKRCSPDFFLIQPNELEDLAHVLKRVLQLLSGL